MSSPRKERRYLGEWEAADSGNPRNASHRQNGAAVVAVESLEALEMARDERACQPDMSVATDRESSSCEGRRSYAP